MTNMASLIPGYEYDIFISYRQKDNKHDGWVTEFVDNLKGELESTFKEEISVYFDINPHDGLLETHDVDASLKDKLKCLVFIPIISRTYCDPKSFAWEHEFKAFVELASQDQFGLKVKLSGGNVASRILPVQIHDLNTEDRKLVESELEGYLRGIEFIYKEPGVNRPLMANEDHPDNNLNKTFYRNQVNKVANAINEIIDGLKPTDNTGKGISEKVHEEKKPIRKPLKTKIFAGSLLLLILIVAGYFIIPKLKKSAEQLEKSIAVLPFINDSPDQENTYFIDAIMDEVLNDLSRIEDFSKVLPRTSVEQFRGQNRYSVPEIAKKLGVNYIVQGSGQKYGNKFILRVQLIAAKNEKHIWVKSYDREIKQPSDIINIQSEIAKSIAGELETTITPDEKQLIEETPTTSLTAYDFFQRGKVEYGNYRLENNIEALKKAEHYYHTALEYDSTFAEAYAGLALTYIDKTYFTSNYFSENFLDSTLILADRALFYNDHLAEAYYARAMYYKIHKKNEQALKEFDKALKYNPNNWEVYNQQASMYLDSDYIKAIGCKLKVISLNHGRELPGLINSLGVVFAFYAGFPEKAKYYYQQALKLSGDTVSYNVLSSLLEIKYGKESGDFQKGIELLYYCYVKDTSNLELLWSLSRNYMYLNDYHESLKYFRKYIFKLEALGQITLNSADRIGYVYWKNGYKKEAEHWFNEQKRICETTIKQGRMYSVIDRAAYYDLAGVYAFLGEKGKAYENLRMFAGMTICSHDLIYLINKDELFDSIRNEPEFKNIVNDLEVKYQTEHERVRKWLEETGQL
jgi:TolB-like protein/Tfp pilus assembly protein PilF